MLIDNNDFSLRVNIDSTESFIGFLSMSFMLSASLFSASENNIFSKIEEGSNTLSLLSSSVELPEKQLDKLLSFCRSINLISVNDGVYKNSDLASKLLTDQSCENILPVLHHMHKHVYPQFGSLSKSLKSGTNQVSDYEFSNSSGSDEFYTALSESSHEFQRFLGAMNTFSKGVGKDLGSVIKFNHGDSMIDLGCGGGIVSKELIEYGHNINLTLIDLEDGIAASKRTFKGVGNIKNITYCVADILSEIDIKPNSTDYVLVSAVLGDWDHNDQLKILKNAYSLLKPGGQLIVSETLLNKGRSGPVLPALMSLYVLLLTKGGENHDPVSISNLLSEAGFSDISITDRKCENLRDIIIARKAPRS